MEANVMAQVLEMLFNQDTVFFALFLFLFWKQQQEKDKQNTFINKQQEVLAGIAVTLEKMNDRIESIENHMDRGDEQ